MNPYANKERFMKDVNVLTPDTKNQADVPNQPQMPQPKGWGQWFSDNLSLGLVITSVTAGTVAGLGFVQSIPVLFAGFSIVSGVTL